MTAEQYSNKLIEKGLKVTPQRIAVLEAIFKLNDHPTADKIKNYIHKNHPNIATATVYKVLDALVKNGIITKVKTEKDIMRYDAILEKHHHLYSSKDDVIVDYKDKQLDELLKNYFANKKVKGFKIEDIVIQLKGTFDKS